MEKRYVLMAALLLFAAQVQADTLLVPSQYPTIQAAITAAAGGDSILIAPGFYAGFHVINGPNHLTILGSGAYTTNPTIIGTPENWSCAEIQNTFACELGYFVTINTDPSGGGGVGVCYSDSCWIHDIDIMVVANPNCCGLFFRGCNNTMTERCLVRAGNYDVVTMWGDASNINLTLRNLTVSGNGNGICNRTAEPGLKIQNCLVFNNADDGVEIHYWQLSYSIEYNDSWGNNGVNYTGFSPNPTNFSANPLVVGGTGWQAYQLTANSPCINAGDPTSPLDPDGTIADIGCFYYDFGTPTGILSLDFEPQNPPIVIPPQGGTAIFDATLMCDSSGYAIFDAWYDVTAPNGQTLSPALLKPGLMMQPNQTIERTLQFYLSPLTQAGIYTVTGYLGDYPSTAYATDVFTFEKSGVGQDGSGKAWGRLTDGEFTNTFALPAGEGALPLAVTLSTSPNPFNPTTVARFELRVASHVSLKVYDTTGRLVGTLVNREMPAGAHTATFDGSQLASGIYLAVLEAGDSRIVDRLLLVK